LRRATLLIVAALVGTGLVACRGTPRRATTVACEVWVSRDFGAEMLKQASVQVADGDSVMEVTRRVCRVETAYGGGFVKSLDGLESTGGRSSQGMDWFYYVDGILAGRGAVETKVSQGSVIWWDYHNWSFGGGQFAAVVGAWPKPVASGCRVLYARSGGSQAGRLHSALEGLRKGSAGPLEAYDGKSLADRAQPVVLVGLAREMLEYPWLAGIFRDAWRAGLPGTVRDSGIVGFDGRGGEKATWKDGSGLIAAMGSYMGDPNPLWLVVGWDEQGLERAVTLLVDGINDEVPALRHAFGVAVTPTGVVKLPLVNAGGGGTR